MVKPTRVDVPLVPYVRLDEVEVALQAALEGEALKRALEAVRWARLDRDAVMVLPEGMPSGSIIRGEEEVTIQKVVLPIWGALRDALRELRKLARLVDEHAVSPPAPANAKLERRLRQVLEVAGGVLHLAGVSDDDERLVALESLMELTEAVPVALETKRALQELGEALESALLNLRRMAAYQSWDEIFEEDRKEVVEEVLRCLAGFSGDGFHILPEWAGGLEWLPPQLKDALVQSVISDSD